LDPGKPPAYPPVHLRNSTDLKLRLYSHCKSIVLPSLLLKPNGHLLYFIEIGITFLEKKLIMIIETQLLMNLLKDKLKTSITLLSEDLPFKELS
jgi:hypothetical protein